MKWASVISTIFLLAVLFPAAVLNHRSAGPVGITINDLHLATGRVAESKRSFFGKEKEEKERGEDSEGAIPALIPLWPSQCTSVLFHGNRHPRHLIITPTPTNRSALRNGPHLPALIPYVSGPTLSYPPSASSINDTNRTASSFDVQRTPVLRPVVILVPGGGYLKWALVHEGKLAAQWLNRIGFPVFILLYSLPHDGADVHGPLRDGIRAVQWVRFHAARYRIDPNKIILFGFSAGGHLATSVVVHHMSTITQNVSRQCLNFLEHNLDTLPGNLAEEQLLLLQTSAMPNFLILAYPVIVMDGPFAHRESVQALLGEKPDPRWVDFYSVERHVSPMLCFPPTFITHSKDDRKVSAENARMLCRALKRIATNCSGHPHELTVDLHEGSRHGYGLGDEAVVAASASVSAMEHDEAHIHSHHSPHRSRNSAKAAAAAAAAADRHFHQVQRIVKQLRHLKPTFSSSSGMDAIHHKEQHPSLVMAERMGFPKVSGEQNWYWLLLQWLNMHALLPPLF